MRRQCQERFKIGLSSKMWLFENTPCLLNWHPYIQGKHFYFEFMLKKHISRKALSHRDHIYWLILRLEIVP